MSVADSAEIDYDALQPVGRGLFAIHGMWCPSCAAATEQVILRHPSVTRARVSFATASALIDWDPAVADLRGILDQVRKVGYEIGAPMSSDETVRRIDAEVRRLVTRLVVTGFFGMWVMILALMRYVEPTVLGDTPTGHVLSVAAFALMLPVVSFGAAPFWIAGWRTLRAGVPGMDALVSLGVAGAITLSAVELASGGAHIFADTAVMLIALLTIGRLIEMRTTRRAAAAIGALEREMPEQARDADTGDRHPAEKFAVGARILVQAGARVPLDGVIEEGASTTLDMSVMTGESAPVVVSAGETVLAGAINLDRQVTLRVTAPIGQRRIDRIMGRMAEMQGDKSELARLSDRLARFLVPFAVGTALTVCLVGVLFGLPVEDATLRALAVVVIACPCALSIAVPIAFLSFAERSLKAGILYRSPAALENAGAVRTLFIDKTGTLTEGCPRVVDAVMAPGWTRGALQDVAATAEAGVDHPVARALCQVGKVSSAQRTRHARGVVARDDAGRSLCVGNIDFLVDQGVDVPRAEVRALATWIHAAIGDTWIGALQLADPVRADAGAAVAALAASDISLHMVTGDATETARHVATEIGFPGEVSSKTTPEEKAQIVIAARPRGLTAFAGDGVNDGPALSAADVGIAVDGANHVATSASGIVIVRGGLSALAECLAIARKARGRMTQNLGFALIYNAAALPAAAFGVVSPSVAALAMLASSVSVIANATR